MASPSKERQINQLIFENSPFKQWHFEEIVTRTNITRAVVNKWLNKLIKKNILKRIKEKGRHPYYVAGKNNPYYQSAKRLHALKQLHEKLIPELLATNAQTIILFGSMAKGDWYKESDIDLFVLGRLDMFEKHIYEDQLNHPIELHVFKDVNEIAEVQTELIQNVVNGYVIKGRIQDVTAKSV